MAASVVASITEATKRFNRIMLLTDSYVVPLSNPPKRRSFNSDAEITDILLEADELLCLDIRNTVGHPWASKFFEESGVLSNGDKIPYSDAPLHRVTWSQNPGDFGTLTVEEASVGASATGYLTISGSATQASGVLSVTTPTGYSTGTLTIAEALQATGTLTVVGTPTNGETLVVNGITFTFIPLASYDDNPLHIPFTTNATNNAAAIAGTLEASLNASITVATYGSNANTVIITYDTTGTAGNSFTLANSSGSHVLRTAATLSGGTSSLEDGESIYVNGFPVVWVENAADQRETPDIIYLTISDDVYTNASNLASALSSSSSTLLNIATYFPVSDSGQVTIQYIAAGAVGNRYLLQDSSADNIIASGDNLTGGVGGVVEGETILINGVTFTFSNFNKGANFIQYDESALVTAGEIADALNNSVNGAITVATYSYGTPPITGDDDNPFVSITYDTLGSTGNSYTIAASSGEGITVTNSTLTGGHTGIVEGETIVINGVTFTFTNLSSGAAKIPFFSSAFSNAVSMAAVLNASVNSAINVATYSPAPSGSTYRVNITYLTHTSTGNTFTLANSSGSAVTRSGATLTGGVDDGGIVSGETLDVNGVLFEFNNVLSGPTYISFTTDINVNASRIYAKLAASSDPLLTDATFSLEDNVVTIYGPDDFTLANSSEDHVSASTDVLTSDFQDSEEADKADIIEAVSAIAHGNIDLFGEAVFTYGYHNFIDNEVYTTSPYIKIIQAPWTRSAACQSPMSYTTAIILTAISLAPKDGLDPNLLNYAEKKSNEFRQMIRSGAMILPAVTEYGMSEV
jgi:hypothetical protein